MSSTLITGSGTDLALTGYIAVDEASDRLFVLVQNSAKRVAEPVNIGRKIIS
jgi:hypothetical protein